MSGPSRRDLLRALGLGTLAACTPEWETRPGRGGDPASFTLPYPVDSERFPLGIWAGDPTPTGLVFGSRCLGDQPVSLHRWWWVGGAWEALPPIPVTHDEAGFVHVETDDLPADTWVVAAIVGADDLSSGACLARTAPAPGTVGTLRMVAVSCLDHEESGGDFPSMRHALARGPVDLMLWLGDTVYTHDHTPEQFRERWAENYQTPDFQRALGAAAHLFTWDDHEVSNNWNPETIDRELLANATRAFFEHTPTRRDPEHPSRIWRKLSFGDIADVFVLDCRAERRPSASEYLSREQLDWLVSGLAASTATWKLVLNSVPITNFPDPFDVPQFLEDRWEGYPEDRAAAVAASLTAPGVLWISGDFHMPALSRIDPEGPGHRLFEVITGAVGSQVNVLGIVLAENHPEVFPWAEGIHTTTRLEVDADGFAHVAFIDDEDVTRFEALIDDRGNLLWSNTVAVER